jgi:restriction endonuclease S subunit
MHDSIINYSDIRAANRLDAEYFQPKFLKLQKNLDKKKYKQLHELCEFIHGGPAGSSLIASRYVASGIKVYRPVDLNGWSCDDTDAVAISEEYCREKHLQLYRDGDILITRIGDIKFGIIQESGNSSVTISPNLFVLRLRRDLIDPYFLLAFLHTKFGLPQIQRRKKIASLSSVGIGQIANLMLPAVSLKEQIKIGNMVKRGLRKIQLAKILYSKAEEILLQGIGITKNEENRSSTVVNHTKLRCERRADAEYFLAQKYTIRESIKSIQIGEIAQIFRGIEPGSKVYQNSGKLFLRVSNIGKYGLLEKRQKYISSDLYEKLKKKYQPEIGEVLLVKDGKPGVALVIGEAIEGIISDGIVRLKPDKSLPRTKLVQGLTSEYISLCINSPICQSQIQADRDGSLVPHWKIEQIKKLRIPVISSLERKSIKNNITKSNILFQAGRSSLIQAIQQAERLIKICTNTV